MHISKKRVVNVENYIATVRDNEVFFIALRDFDSQIRKIQTIGFSQNPQAGEQVLPTIVGPVSRFNSNGRYNIRRDLPKEEFFVERYWKRRDWQGNETEEIVFVSRDRYHRDLVTPPCEELLVDNYNGNSIIVSRAFIKSPESYGEIKHTINLFLEIFGECDLIREDYVPFLYENITHLNWKIFPRGEYPWEAVREIAQERIQRQPIGNRPVIASRLEKITSHTPNFVAVGQGGFYDYIVFGFPAIGVFILESIKSGNATYVFDQNWEELSRMTKAEILNDQLQLDRIFHSPGWEIRINQILG